METVNNMAQAAAKAVWGDGNKAHGEEPVSGQQGDTSKGEPFDKGNLEEQPPVTETKLAEPTKTTTDTTTETDKSYSPELATKDTTGDTSKGQNDTRDPENPTTDPKNSLSDVNNTGDDLQNPEKVDGPGPKPIEQVAKEHGGDAGNTESSPAHGEDKTAATENKDEASDRNDPRALSKGEGTGELHVKSTGLQADGGDFDATKPGAGREADRLMEEKGLKKDSSNGASSGSVGSVGSSGSGEKENKGLSTKLKEKLHIH